MSSTRRNPKRKAAQLAAEVSNLPENLLEEALTPVTAEEIEAWDGWVELESEPAFFNVILRDWGVRNVKAEEIFTIDQSSLDVLPQPVHGLIFLFQYLPDLEDNADDETDAPIWFANQTINNACATVALINIIMNADGIELGDKLRAFQDSTQHLDARMRGYKLSTDSFLRKTHNSFTKRMDHLNADLCLDNEVEHANKKRPRKRAASVKTKGAKRKNAATEEYGFHFIAYVPAAGYVWELDGLRSNPAKIGAFDSQNWTAVARPHIEARMLLYEESQLSFNLLALCQSPLSRYADRIAQGLASFERLTKYMRSQPSLASLVAKQPTILDINNKQDLLDYNLSKPNIDEADISPLVREAVSGPHLSAVDAQQLCQEIIIDTKATMGEFRAEMISMADTQQRVEGRKKDFALALHKWVTKLAEKGILEDIVETS